MADRIRIAKGVHIYRTGPDAAWYADVCAGGRRTRRSTGTTDEIQARAVAAEIAAQSGAIVRDGYTLDHALAAWMMAAERTEQERSTVRVLRRTYTNRAAHLVDDKSLQAAYPAKSCAAGTYNRALSIVRAALRMAADRGDIAKAPKLKKRREPAGRVAFLRVEQIKALLAALPAHQRPMVEFALATGLRRANVLGLRWDQVDLPRKMLRIDAGSMKAGEHHGLPLSDAAVRVLKSVAGEHDTFVFTFRGQPIQSPKTGWKRAVKAAGLEGFRWHDLRHTWASYMAMSGAPLTAIRDLGGWASLEMVARYAHLSVEHLREQQNAASRALKVGKRKVA